MDVGVRELKQHLSKYLERVARGEQIRVTDRGTPKAILGPIPGRFDLDAAVAEGWLTPGNGRAVARIRRGRSGRRVSDVLTEDRET